MEIKTEINKTTGKLASSLNSFKYFWNGITHFYVYNNLIDLATTKEKEHKYIKILINIKTKSIKVTKNENIFSDSKIIKENEYTFKNFDDFRDKIKEIEKEYQLITEYWLNKWRG